MKIENHLTGINISKSTTEPGNVNDNFYADMLKNRKKRSNYYRWHNINSRGLSKSKTFEVLNFPRAASNEILGKIDDVLNQKPESLIVYVRTNDFTNKINLRNIIKNKISVIKTKQKSPNTVLSFSKIIIRKDKKKLKKLRADTISKLKNYCSRKNLRLINYENIKTIWVSRSYIWKERVTVSLQKTCWIFNYEGDLFIQENCVSNDSTFSQSDIQKVLKDIRISIRTRIWLSKYKLFKK